MNSYRVFATVSLGLAVLLSACVAPQADEVYRQRQRGYLQQSLPEAKHLVGIDEQLLRRGKASFNGRAVCFGCHGVNGDINQVNNPDVAKLNPKPTDLRESSDKSIRQLYLTIKYGIPGTGMVPVEEDFGLRNEEMYSLVSYVLALQGKPLTLSEITSQVHDREGLADLEIYSTCAKREIYSKAQEMCEHQIRQRYRELLVGRPPDISPARYTEIQSSCTQRFRTNLDDLTKCYNREYGITRRSLN